MTSSATHVLTQEQCNIINYTANDGTKVLINAFAGCAKTTTTREIVKHWRDMLNSGMSLHHNQRASKRFLYLVFNKDAECAAKEAFYQRDKTGALVHVRTHHSLALKFFIELLRAKIQAGRAVGAGVQQALAKIDQKIAQLQGGQTSTNDNNNDDPAMGADEFVEEYVIDDSGETMHLGRNSDESIYSALVDEDDSTKHELPLDLESDELKPFGLTRGDPALQVLENFCHEKTNENEPSAAHVAYLLPDRAMELELAPVQRQILTRAQAAWRATVNGRVNPRNGRLIISHEATLKLFCQSRESETFIADQYHTILFDEAQDIDVILMHWIEKARKFACYLVGDAFQSIYNFKGALNAMAHLQNLSANNSNIALKTFYLSQSFRFGPSVAEMANSILHHSGRFDAVECAARLSSAATSSDTKITYVTAPPTIKRQKVERTLSRQEIASHYIADLYHSRCNNNHEDNTAKKEITVIARKNNTLLTLAIELASQNVFVALNGKLLEKLRHGALVLSKFDKLEYIDGRVDFLLNVLRSVQRNIAIGILGADGDAMRASGQTPWFQFVKPLADCGDMTFSSITSRVCDQVHSELHILQLALFMRDLNKTKTSLARLLQNSDSIQQQQLLQEDADDDDRGRSNTITLSTVHAAKGGEWDDVVVMDDFPDMCTLICAVNWCRGNKSALFKQSLFSTSGARKQVEGALKHELLSTIHSSLDRDDAMSFIMRTLTSAESFVGFLTSLDEELHLYYVAVTRAKKHLHIGVSLQRFLNKVE